MQFLYLALALATLGLTEPVPAKKPALQAYEPCPALRVLACCTGVTAGVGGAGTALGNGCESYYSGTIVTTPPKLLSQTHCDPFTDLSGWLRYWANNGITQCIWLP